MDVFRKSNVTTWNVTVSGVVWRQTGDSGDAERTLRDDVMRLCHDVPSAGHQGVTRSKKRLRQNFYWWRMSGDIKDYVRACDACNRNKKSSFPHRAPYKVYQAGSPMERVHLDLLGPLPRTEEAMNIY